MPMIPKELDIDTFHRNGFERQAPALDPLWRENQTPDDRIAKGEISHRGVILQR